MEKKILVLSAVIFCILCFTGTLPAEDIAWEEIGNGNYGINTAVVSPDNPRIMYLGTKNSVLKSEDGGVSWKNVLSISGENRRVNFLFFGPHNKNAVYAGTGNGLYYSADQGKSWKRVFHSKWYLENECTCLAVAPYGIYLGTKAGLFLSRDEGRTWHKEQGKLGTVYVLAIAFHPKNSQHVYAACRGGVFKTENAGSAWERIFGGRSPEDTNTEEPTEEAEEGERGFDIRSITVDNNYPHYVYCATSAGIYSSKDGGATWKYFTDYGLLNRDVRLLLCSPQSDLYAMTKSGIFLYRNQRWQELSFGLIAVEMRHVTLDNRNTLYAVSEKGFFKAGVGTLSRMQLYTTMLSADSEPKIHEVQQTAIKYAEVEPEKIMRWRKQAKMKALLPKLTLGLDRSESTNYEIYTSATTHYVYEGPHDKRNGWDVTLSWELGDLIWNDDQTSIDVRSRLMVQLRDDILDEVTKLYYERMRVKNELSSLSLEEGKKRFEKELRLQELTAYLDGLTGGYFSQHNTARLAPEAS